MVLKLTLYLENETNQDGVKELSDIQESILNEIQKNPSITTNELAQKTGIKFRTLQRYISQLQTLGFLAREGSRKDGYWVVGKHSRKYTL